MYRFIRLFKDTAGFNRVEFSTPSGKIRKSTITEREADKIRAAMNDELLMDNILYGIA